MNMLCIFCESKFEAQQLLAKLNDYKIVTDYLFNIYEIKLNGKEIILVQAGEGKVNFAYAMGVITEKYPITAVIGFGNCGYIGKQKKDLGDIAISDMVFQYDVDFQANHYRLFEIPGTNQVVFPRYLHLKQFALMACKYLDYKGQVGLFGTADRFINSSIISEHLNQSYRIEFIDVEAAVLGQVAYRHHLPFICVKAISHYGDDDAFQTFKQAFQAANERSSDVVYTMLEAMTRKGVYC